MLLYKIMLLVSVAFTVDMAYLTPPEPWQAALMARYIIHKCDWVSFATISTLESVKGYPYVTLKSMSDGPVNNGTGIPYLYMTEMDVSGKDITVNNNCTIMATLAETDYCNQEDFDPQDPRCAKLIISGKLIQVDNATHEYNFAHDALFTRHPAMKWWPKDHDFYVAKVELEQIAVLDYFGGMKHVSIKDYLNANGDSSEKDNIKFRDNEFASITVIAA